MDQFCILLSLLLKITKLEKNDKYFNIMHFKVVCMESALSKLNKNNLICLVLDMQKTPNSKLSDMKNELTDMKNELSDLRKNYTKLEANLKVSKSITEAMKNHIIVLEHKCWSNEQYSRRECLEISGIPSDTEAGKLENITKSF